jgi:DNA-nicking Smr family endonuclease
MTIKPPPSPVVPDMELWRHTASSVRPLDVAKGFDAQLLAYAGARNKRPEQPKHARTPIDTPIDRGGHTRDLSLDLGINRALRQKKFSIDAKIDLHGMTEKEAYSALMSFLGRAVARQLRTLLVITGKGAKGKGVIKTNTERWIEAAFSEHVLGLTEAPPDLGGSGALLLRLRKNK